MEDALRGGKYIEFSAKLPVLILVLMEDALRAKEHLLIKLLSNGLNPCSNGRCSKRKDPILIGFHAVLILVLMEDALRAYVCCC